MHIGCSVVVRLKTYPVHVSYVMVLSTHVKETLSHLSDDRLFRNLNALDLFVGSFTIPDEGLLVLCTDWFNLG